MAPDFDLGVVTGLRFLPILVLGSLGGLLADRMDKRRLLVKTQAAAGLPAAALAALTPGGPTTVWLVDLLALLLGLVQLWTTRPVRASPRRWSGPAGSATR